MEFLDSDASALIALQGPTAVSALEDISSLSFKDLYFMQTRVATVAGVEGCRITRCGYTGLFDISSSHSSLFLFLIHLKAIQMISPNKSIGLTISVLFSCIELGEDGVEISLPGERASYIVDALLNSTQAKVQLAGLGARDSLRLEAGLCLYGNDIDQDTSPIEAGLAWLVGK